MYQKTPQIIQSNEASEAFDSAKEFVTCVTR